ncbi:MAG TPA: hypothetical protein VIG69_16765 [Candidatus Methylomirabilis sp.]|jgi:hypothetical protein
MAAADWALFALWAGALICVGSLAAQLRRWLDLPDQRSLAPPRGSEAAGVRYAFTRGMDPTRKESAGKHWPTYVAGVLYHLAIAGAALTLVGSLALPAPPPDIRAGLLVLLALGLTGGVGIQVKRAVRPQMRAFSTPDDFAANALVDVFLLGAWAAVLTPAAYPAFHLAAAALLAYLPFSKLRHVLFFFLARYYLGVFFGRRGVLPPPAPGRAGRRGAG